MKLILNVLILIFFFHQINCEDNFTTQFFCYETSHKGKIECHIDNQVKEYENRDDLVITADNPDWWLDFSLVVFCVLCAGLMSGLTIGLMGLDLTNLEILKKSGSESERKLAKRILPLIKRHHLLLVTLLLGNALANEALPIFLEALVPPAAAIVVSVTLLLFFGEIIPQAICARWGLAIGANLAWLVWILIALSFIITYPISKILDCIIGKEHRTFFKRKELKELMALHGEKMRHQEPEDKKKKSGDIEEIIEDQESDKGEEWFRCILKFFHIQEKEESKLEKFPDDPELLTYDEITVIRGALDLRSKTVQSVMKPFNDTFMLDLKTVIDHETKRTITKVGYTRILVYHNSKENIVGMILSKSLIIIDPKDKVLLSSLEILPVPHVSASMPLYNMLNVFQTGKSHMAVVYDDGDHISIRGIITLEDVIEELIQEEIEDECDVRRRQNSSDDNKNEHDDKVIDINTVYYADTM